MTQLGSTRHDCPASYFVDEELDGELRGASDASSSYNVVRSYDASKDDTINESLRMLSFLHKLQCNRLHRAFNVRR